MSSDLSGLLTVSSSLSPHSVNTADETLDAQSVRVQGLILFNWWFGRVYVANLYKENKEKLMDRGYTVKFFSSAVYPPLWEITWRSISIIKI